MRLNLCYDKYTRMEYRRNSDEGLRKLEENWRLFPDDIEALSALNRARKRANLPLLKMDPPLEPKDLTTRLKTVLGKNFWAIELSQTQFPAYYLKKDILDETYPIVPNEKSVNALRNLLIQTAVPLVVESGWVALLMDRPTVKLKIVRKPSTDEWVVRWIENGRVNENKSVYTNDKEDAQGTLRHMQREIKYEYPLLYFVPQSVIELSGDQILPAPRGVAIADAWKQFEDPRSLTDPSYRRGSHPTKNVLAFQAGRCPLCHGAGHNMITVGKQRILEDCSCRKLITEGRAQEIGSYFVWNYIVSYDEEIPPYYANGNYDLIKEEGYAVYLSKLLKLNYTSDFKIYF